MLAGTKLGWRSLHEAIFAAEDSLVHRWFPDRCDGVWVRTQPQYKEIYQCVARRAAEEEPEPEPKKGYRR